ncbi:hypothetical protein Tco_0662756 [Tanacetum coccineum]
MEDEFYNLAVKGNDLKTYIRRFQELAILCPNMVPNSEKLMEVFISGLPRSIEGNVTASKPQTLEEATNIAQRLMDQIIKHDSVQETNDHKRKFEDKGNIINNNNYQNNYNNNNRNNDYHQQQNRRQETFRTYAATNGYTGNRPLCERCTLHHIETLLYKVLSLYQGRALWHINTNSKQTGPPGGAYLTKRQDCFTPQDTLRPHTFETLMQQQRSSTDNMGICAINVSLFFPLLLMILKNHIIFYTLPF